MNSRKTSCKYFSAMLIALALFVSGLFNTSGYIISTVQVSSAQIELTLGQQNSINESGIYFSESYTSSPADSPENCSSPFIFNSSYLANFNTLISVKHRSISNKLNGFNPICHFTQLTGILQNSDDPFKS